jgi:GT2 family glycosyltransferase
MDSDRRGLVDRLKRRAAGVTPEQPAAKPEQPAATPGRPVTTTFLGAAYVKDNADVAETYGNADAATLEAHFDRYGRHENRGIWQHDYCNFDTVTACENGVFFMSGWADRRIVASLKIAIEIGYVRHELGEIDACWYHRGDVSTLTGDDDRPAGFMALIRVPDIALHSRVRVLINGQEAFSEKSMRWRSVGHFLTQVLGACAVLSDQPIGATLECAERLQPGFDALWSEFLDGVRFVPALEHGAGDAPVRQSIIVVLHRTAAMLLPQLEGLAGVLAAGDTEIIVVGNALTDSARLVARLRGFCQIHDIRLRLYLCSDNAGFSAANNFGAEVARGETLIFMNPDVFPPETDPDRALAFLTGDPGDGLTGALLYYGDGLLMHSGMYVARDLAFDPRRGRSDPVLRVEHYGKGLSHVIDDDSASIEPVMAPIRDRKLLVTAALWKIRKSLFDKMGGLSTDYLFAYYEDADFCLRLLQAGHPVRIDEAARWIHMEGVGKAKPPHVRSFMWLNRALFTRRFAGSDLVATDDTDLFDL